MHNYVEPYPTCDLILKLLVDTVGHRMDEGGINNEFRGNTHVRAALHQLVKDGFLEKDPPTSPYLLLLPKGAQLYSHGGYKEDFQKKRLAEEIKRQLDDATLTMSQSVKATNEAMVRNIRRNNVIIVLTLAVAAISAFGTVGTFVISYEQGKQSKSPILQNILQKQEKAPQPLLKSVPGQGKDLKDSVHKK
jgi:hypothetical protein